MEDKLKMSKPKIFNDGISPLSKKVIAECDGKEYKFNSAAEAERSSIFDKLVANNSIIKCCKGKLKSAGKLNGKKVTWRYCEAEKRTDAELKPGWLKEAFEAAEKAKENEPEWSKGWSCVSPYDKL
jgi:hypothetical protein